MQIDRETAARNSDAVGLAAAKRGQCETCKAKTHHGPWTNEQIAEATADMGIDESEFIDWCDECLVREIGQGDVAYTERLLARPMAVQPKTTGLLALIDAYQNKEPQ